MVFKKAITSENELKMEIIRKKEKKEILQKGVKIFFSFLFAALGVLTILYSTTKVSNKYNGEKLSLGELYVGSTFDKTSYEWYGGDAYTGIQQAAADASNNAAAVGWTVYNAANRTNYGLEVINKNINSVGKITSKSGLNTIKAYQNILMLIGIVLTLGGLFCLIKSILSDCKISNDEVDCLVFRYSSLIKPQEAKELALEEGSEKIEEVQE